MISAGGAGAGGRRHLSVQSLMAASFFSPLADFV
jgi:hypothetical protein